MKYSKQREAIFEAVLNNKIHPTADDVYNFVRISMPNISLGTVYRNLNILSDNGRISKIPVPNGKDRFDGTCDLHYHMFCCKCEKVFDCPPDVIEGLDEKILNETDFLPLDHNLVIYGICGNCKKSVNNPQKD